MNRSRSFVTSILFIYVLLLCNSCRREIKVGDSERFQKYLNLSQEDRLKPEHATESFEVHNGLEVALFASEPMVINPTNFDIDSKGRVWVCESYNYAVPENQQAEAGGRISILEDTDHDGRADKRTIFYQGEDVNIALGIAVLGNKVYVTRSPDILVFTDENGDDKPDRKEKLFTNMGRPGDHSAHAIVFGPDGKFYFNMGNHGGNVSDINGKIIKDKAGNEVIQNGEHYIGGMIFRCNPDGTDVEVIGHNFRNNYEVTVDSYGNLWQSDNDDDGNKSCRINFILEYGNYGYLDEMTRLNWSAQRTNIEDEIERRHWHQNDPGVVPNLLITGAGSPAGITVYEGNLLPEVFHKQLMHADAGPNVVRAYPVNQSGAGYTAGIENIVKAKFDQWFRPIDACVAPDGSLFIADWYDPIVGGGAAGDSQRGRIFRVGPDAGSYKIPNHKITSIGESIDALKSPNQATRFLAWTQLHSLGEEAEPALLKLFESNNPIHRARALWLLGKIPGKEGYYIERALKDNDPNVRIIGVRMARQSNLQFEHVVKDIVNDSSSSVRREIAIGLHTCRSRDAAVLWAELANQYSGDDRWYLEALGIGAANHWDDCFTAWKNNVGENWNSQSNRDIVWRSRSKHALPLLARLIEDTSTQAAERARYFRAFDFHLDESKYELLLGLLTGNNPSQQQITLLALTHIDPQVTGMPPALKKALNATLESIKGTPEYINLVRKYNLIDKKNELLELSVSHGGKEMGTEAIRLLLDVETFNCVDLIRQRIGKNDEDAIALIASMQPLGNKESLDIMADIVLDKKYSFAVRNAAILGLGKTWPGESKLLECVKEPTFDSLLNVTAGSVLFNVYRVTIQQEAEKYLKRPGTSSGKTLPPIRSLLASTGNVTKGKAVFEKYCQVCHVVNAQGTNFGPQLSEIGDKLSKEGLYRAVMFPSEGISYNFEGYILSLKDGSNVIGILESETSDFTELKMIGGTKNKYNNHDILSKEMSNQSLMPNLSTVMSEDELIDLVEYLSGLKKNSI